MDELIVKRYYAVKPLKCNLCSADTFWVLSDQGRESTLCKKCLKEHLKLSIEERQKLLKQIDDF